GGSLSHLTAIVAARTARLPEGDLARGTIYYSRETHTSVPKAARIAGLSARNLRVVPVDARLRLLPEELERMIDEDQAHGLLPFMIVANAGTTNTGAVDPTPMLAHIASRRHMWLHADAAYGGFFRIVDRGESVVPGLELCDSITLDPHKGLFLPYGTGCLLVKDLEVLRRAHASDAHYLQDVAAAAGAGVTSTHPSRGAPRACGGWRLWLPSQFPGVAVSRAQRGEKLARARGPSNRRGGPPAPGVREEPQLSIVAFAVRARPGQDANA